MNKVQFINELKRKLKNLPSQELNDAINYYSEYFEDAGMDDSVDVENEFGSPSSVASQILADYAVKDMRNIDKTKKSNISSIWFIILAIFASPIALPLAFALVITTMALIFAAGAVIFAFCIASLSIAFSGIIVFVSGISILISEFTTSLLLMGIGLTLCGLGLLVLMGILILGNKILRLILTLSKRFLNKVNNKERL